MTSRLDRLVTLLESGTTLAVRQTAAKQLGDITKRFFSPDAPASGAESHSGKEQEVGLEAGWEEASALVVRILPFLRSKAMDTRLAAVDALNHIALVVPVWDPATATSAAAGMPPDINRDISFSVQHILERENTLVASAGTEFRTDNRKRSREERLRAQKDMLGSVGIQNMDSAELIGDADMDVDVPAVKLEETEPQNEPRKRQKLDTSRNKLGDSKAQVEDPLAGLSGRQMIMLKRKRKAGVSEEEIAEEAMRMRLGVAPSSTTDQDPVDNGLKISRSKEGTPVKAEAASQDRKSSGRVNGGGPSGQTDAGFFNPQADLNTGQWMWQPYVEFLAGSLSDPTWEVRHGAALALSAVLKVHGGTCGMVVGVTSTANSDLHERAMLSLAHQALRTMILDRFGDFVGDQVIAPVREATSQTLASLLQHMSESTLTTVHKILLEMIFQKWTTASTYAWEVRHAGLLGLKYEVALRSDMFGTSSGPGDRVSSGQAMSEEEKRLQEVVAAASSGLGDRDDDVRAVSASCLTPIATVLVDKLSDAQLGSLLDGLWQCFLVDGDDLGSSIASVMVLLSKLLSLPRLISFYATDIHRRAALDELIPRLYPFFRHPIMQVRLILVRTIKVFLENPTLPKAWVDSRIFHLLYENFILEERESVRDSTAEAWTAGLALTATRPELLASAILKNLGGWLNIAMTPIGDGLNRRTFLGAPPAGSGTVGGHMFDVDKHMLASDLSLVTEEAILRNRIDAVRALAAIARYDMNAATHMTLLAGYMLSTSAHQLFLSAVLAEEWAFAREDAASQGSIEPLPKLVPACEPVAAAFLRLLENGVLAEYYESKPQFELLRRESESLKQTLEREASSKKRKHEINIQIRAVEDAQTLVGPIFQDAVAKYPSTKRAQILASAEERRRIIDTVITSYKRLKASLDNRVMSATAAAVVALRIVPAKVNPIIQNLMHSVKGEVHEKIQIRAANALARFVVSCLDSRSPLPSGPPNKIISNLANFLCQDETYTPQVLRFPQTDGILTLGLDEPEELKAEDSAGDAAEQSSSFLIRRGAQHALQAVVQRLGPGLLDGLPRLWQVMTEALVARLADDAAPQLFHEEVQGVVDALTILQTVVPYLDQALLPRVAETLPPVTRASRSKWAVVRTAGAACLAALCQTLPEQGIKAILNRTVPLLSDVSNLHHRQGGIEALNLVISKLDMTILPYVLFLIVPVLGRMSDPDPAIRALSTNTFATLVKMIPLEGGMPEPPGFSAEEKAQRESERDFIAQLIDNKRVASYAIPVPIDAELRPYQRDGVSWLAFLAKYQLHGILCDDMGLGKSLQSICIMASKHEERRMAFEAGHREQDKPLLSLIVCPPTLIGHWHSEIPKFCSNLKPLRYLGNSGQREAIRSRFPHHDVIITSYEAVRADIAYLSKQNFLYCILDEGHAIKNGKSKLSQAIKRLKAVHRLVLSGTPIQNNVLELWSLFDFLMPGFLGTERSFHERFSRPILANREGKASPKQKEAATLALDALHKQVLPFLLRRLKTDVLDDLPPKIVQDYECDLSAVQQRLYDDFAKAQSAKASDSTKGKSDVGKQHIFQSLQYLRKLCNHPMLALDGNEAKLREAIRNASSGRDAEDVPKDILDLRHSPKLLALKQILNDCGIGDDSSDLAEDQDTMSRHRVLVFCQSRSMLDLIEKLLFARNMSSVAYMRLDGGTAALDRHEVAQRFNNDPSIDVLLLTTSVGGLGLTLTGADTVVFVDHDWNPMKDLQAMDRAHRIGQKKVVNVYRLITKGTLEEKIMGLQRFKINVANSVVNQQNSGLATMGTDQVLDLFSVSADDDAGAGKGKSGKASDTIMGIPSGGNGMLAGLEDLPPEDEYSSLSLEAFISKS